MAMPLLETFERLDPQLQHVLSEVSSPLLLSLAALDIADRESGVQRLTAEHIVACLEAAGVAVKRTSVSRALARAGNKVSTSSDLSGEVSYKLMTRGRKEIEHMVQNGALSVVRIEGGRPHTARKHLGDLLESLAGVVRISDPYYGMRTLETLDHISPKTKIQFLTSKTNESLLKVQGAFRDFSKERKNAEFRLLAPPHDLHDRYVLAADSLLLIGHGLKDIGGKESFVVSLDRSLASDLLDDLTQSFDNKWAGATSL
jgi:hypothetical protein